MKWWELRYFLADFSQRWQGIRQRRRTRTLLCTFMLRFNGKGMFSGSRISLMSHCEWIKYARRLVIHVNFCVCSARVEKRSVRKLFTPGGIELICEFAKIWLIITKTCFDSFLLFLRVWLLCKSFWKAVWRVRVVHLHSARTFKSESVFSDCQQIVKKICFVVFCAEMLQQFSPTFAKRLLTSCVFLSHSETLHRENKIDKEFWLNRNLYSSWLKVSS